MDWDILKKHLPGHRSGLVPHYTSFRSLNQMIPGGSAGIGSAWASAVQFLNDRRELDLGLERFHTAIQSSQYYSPLLPANIEFLRSTDYGWLRTDPFQMSFSGNADELGQWRGYAENGLGCSISVAISDLEPVAAVTGWVIYDEREQLAFVERILTDLESERNDVLVQQTIIAASCFIKHEGFRSEQEFRALFFPEECKVEFREMRGRVVPYFDFLADREDPIPIRKIIIGPGWQLADAGTDRWIKNPVVLGALRLFEARRIDIAPDYSRIPYDPR